MRERISVALAVVFVTLGALACKGKSLSGFADAATVGASFKKGDDVDVEWNGQWWKGNVLSVSAGPTYRIHYVGWGPEWDEDVGPSRIRARTAGSRSK